MKSSTPWGWRLLYGILILFLIFGVAEVVLRMIVPSQRFEQVATNAGDRWMSHPFVPHAGKRNASYRFRPPGSAVEIEVDNNDDGFRAHQFSKERDPEEFSILCLGGAVTYGLDAPSNGDTWPELLQHKLEKNFRGKKIRVYNMGVETATTAISTINLSLIGIHTRPNIVLVYHGPNDLASIGHKEFRTDQVHFYNDYNPTRSWLSFRKAIPSGLRQRSYVFALGSAALDSALGLTEPPYEPFRERVEGPDRFHGIDATLRNFKTINAVSEGRGAKAVFSTYRFPRDGDPLENKFNALVRDYLDANKFSYIDMERELPVGAGREEIAQRFFEYLTSSGLID